MSKMPNLGGVFWCAVTILTISAGRTFEIFTAVKKKLFPIAGSPGLRLVSSRLQRAVIVAVGFAWAASAGALTFSERLVFSTTDQSQWGSGPAVNLSNGGFLGVPGFSEGASIGGITCAPPFSYPCLGAEIGFQVAGRAGLNYDIKINSGSLSVYFPERVSFTLPDPLAVKIGRPFDIVSTLLPATILTFKPILQTIGPTVQAYVDMGLQAGLKAVAQVCLLLGCTGPRLEVGVDKTQELLSFNHNGDGQFRVLGGEVIPSGSGTVNRGPLNLRVQQPILNSDSRVKIEGFGGFDGTLLRSSDRGNVLDLSASLDKIVSDLLGLPPLNAKEGGFGYNIITANAGISIDVSQKFTFKPDLKATFNFTSPVIQETSSGFLPATSSIMFHVGDTLTLRAPGAQVLGVAPVFTLDNVTRNETGLNINSDIFVSAGGISAFGIDAGPLFEEQVSTHLTDIPLFGENFSVNVPTIRSDPFNIVFDPLAASFVDFNDPCLTFSGMNGLLCDKSGLLAVFNSDGSGKNVFKIANLYDLIDKSGIGCQNNQFVLDGLGRFMCGAEIDTTAFVNNLLALISTTKIGDTSRLLFDPDGGTVYYNGPLPEDLLSGPLPVSDDTDLGSAQRLAGLGFSNDFAAFDIPAGDPFPASVPEPSSLLLLLGGLVSLAIRSTGLRPKGPVS